MLKQIQENFFLLFSLSLIASYFGCSGYYSFFNIDITSFLSIEDLSLVFAKWIWISIFILSAIIYSLIALFTQRFTMSRGIIIIFLIILGSIILYLSKDISGVLSQIFILGFILILLIGFIGLAFNLVKDKSDISNLGFKDWFTILAATIMFTYIVPFFFGKIMAANQKLDNIRVVFDNNSKLNTADSTNLIYVGKTRDYFFINNSRTHKTSVFRMDKVQVFEVTQNN